MRETESERENIGIFLTHTLWIFVVDITRPEIVKVSGPLNALQKKKKLKEILRECVPVDLDNIVGFESLTNDVYAEFSNLEQVTGVKVRSFFDTFDIFVDFTFSLS